MSDAKSLPAEASAPKKAKSSPLGRIIIGILLIVLAIEAVPYARMSLAHAKLTSELKKADSTDHKITPAQVAQMMGGRAPDLSKRKRVAIGDELYDVYYFNGMLKRRELCVHYGVPGENDPEGLEREMMEVTTNIPEEILVDDGPIIKPTTAVKKSEDPPAAVDATKEEATPRDAEANSATAEPDAPKEK